MTGDLIGSLFIGIAFGTALLVPGVQAYRGRYRSWIYRGTGTRYGAFATGISGAGVILMFTSIAFSISGYTSAYYVVGGLGFLLLMTGLFGFVWLPRALVPAWRQARLDNARLYRSGVEAVPLTSTTIKLVGDRALTVFRRQAPVVDSEYVALSVTGMHVRPRLRLPAVLSELHGDLVIDVDIVLFVQAPSAEAEHKENFFAILPGPPDETTVSDTAAGATWTLTPASGDRPVTITVPEINSDALCACVRRATRPRRYRQTIHGRVTGN